MQCTKHVQTSFEATSVGTLLVPYIFPEAQPRHHSGATSLLPKSLGPSQPRKSAQLTHGGEAQGTAGRMRPHHPPCPAPGAPTSPGPGPTPPPSARPPSTPVYAQARVEFCPSITNITAPTELGPKKMKQNWESRVRSVFPTRVSKGLIFIHNPAAWLNVRHFLSCVHVCISRAFSRRNVFWP